MKIYLVGGAVRDRLLGLPVEERDWVVTGATEQEMAALGYQQVDADFPVFLHPESGEEYALARREVKTGPGYKGFRIETGPDVTLEEDLARRDLTINAMAEADDGTLIDPYGGRDDLEAGLLRHVTPAFVEDPVRLPRVARFAAKLAGYGFRVAHDTFTLMERMAASEDLRHLRPERLWREMKKSFAMPQPWRFFETLQRCGALQVVIPSLSAQMTGEGSHGGGGSSQPMAALQRAVSIGAPPEVCFAVTFAGVDAEPAALCQQLRAEKDYAQLLRGVHEFWPLFSQPRLDARQLLELLQRGRALQRPDYFAQLLTACAALHQDADFAGRRRLLLQRAVTALAGVSAEPLLARGLQGAELGAALARAREQALAVLL